MMLKSRVMIPESELMKQARLAMEEKRLDDAQSILVNVVVGEPANDDAWLLLAETISDPQRKLECLEKAKRIDAHNPATLRAIHSLQNEIAQGIFGQRAANSVHAEISTKPEFAVPYLESAEKTAHAVNGAVEPNVIRALGAKLVDELEHALNYDEIRTRRWARSIGRDALVKYERALTNLISTLPQDDSQLAALREQRRRALKL